MLLRRLALVILVSVCSLTAQEFRATLQGTITDPSQAAVPSATVVLRNVQTGIEREMPTDETGHYLFQFVAPGSYSLTVKASGFKTTVREGIALSLNDNIRLDVELPLGETAETVSVVADVAVVQAESSSLGSVVNREIIDNLPLKGHSSLYMYNLATGVVGNRYWEDVRPSDTGTNVLFTANGAPLASGDVSVDGVANTVNVGRGLALSPWVPPTDAVAEMKLQMGTLPAEYGRAGGAITNIVIKSGTNELHGSMYEFFRSSALDANQFFPRGLGQKLTPYTVNTFGASIGGPVYLPKLYDGRNRTFFFFSYEGSREGNGQSTRTNVPTAKMRQGDFTEIPNTIYDPYSVQLVNGVATRTPIPGKIIPASQQDPVARNIMKYWPEPNNTPPTASTPWVQNFVQGSKWPTTRDGYVVKIDHQLTQKHQTYTRFNMGDAYFNFNYAFDGLATTGRNVVNRPNKGLAINDTYMINPRTTLDTRVGYAYGKEQQRPYSFGFDLGSLGFSPQFVNLAQYKAFPSISISGFQGLAGSGYVEQPGYTYSLQSSLSMQRSKHLFKTGTEIRLLRGNFFKNNVPAGSFSFAQASTGGPNATATTSGTGFAMASFMMGWPSGGSIFQANGVSVQNVYYGFYFQDDYRVSSRLTLNMGIRFEYESPRTERYNRTTRGFAYNTPSPLKVPGMNLTGGLLYAGVDGADRGIYDPDRNNFAPRFGFAYSLNPKTIFRGGYALSYIPLIGSVFPEGYSNTTTMVTTQDGYTPVDTLRNPFPGGLLPLVGNSQRMLTLVGQSVSFVEPSDMVPVYHNWQFNFQRELAGRTMFEVAYVGGRGIHLAAPPTDFTGAVNEQLNQFDPKYLSMGADLNKAVTNPFFGYLTGSLGGRTISQSQLLRPYPQFQGVTRNAPAFGNNVYHSVQMKLEKRMSRGVTALVAYTIAKNISDLTNAQNNYDRQAERALSDWDVPQRLTLTAAWDLPFGQKRHFGANMSRALDLIVGGWTLSTFNTFQGGFPVGFGLSRSAAGTGSGRPNANGDPSAGISGPIVKRLNRYFNTDAFAQPADYTWGNLSPRIGTVRSPGMNNMNVTLSKDFRITERASAEFRASSFNFLNHPVFSGPNTTFGNADFGRVSNQVNQGRQTELALRIIF
ncbi:MAG: carboxypeptidase regulatory-like domain-containing protein [Bryobacterales bacterium]|nr:carboxypeptidase regulatory-like domain-containing protein [Bryobacterales bacterium]